MLERSIWVLAMLLLTAPAIAHDEEEEEDTGPWSGKAALGYLATSGNTENTSLNASFSIAYTTDKWQHRFMALAINASDDELTTSEAYEAAWRSEYSFSEFDYLFGRLHWRKDRFSSFESQFSQTVGYGRRLINSQDHKLDVDIGLGLRQSERVDGSTEDEFIVRGGLQYEWFISDNAKFSQLLGVESGEANTYVESVSALSAKIVGDLALVASYSIKHNTDVLPLTEKTDTYTALSLEYAF